MANTRKMQQAAAGAGDDYGTFDYAGEGTLWSCGSGGKGALGRGFYYNSDTWGQIGTREDWIRVVGYEGYYGTSGFGITSDGKLWSWGWLWHR